MDVGNGKSRDTSMVDLVRLMCQLRFSKREWVLIRKLPWGLIHLHPVLQYQSKDVTYIALLVFINNVVFYYTRWAPKWIFVIFVCFVFANVKISFICCTFCMVLLRQAIRRINSACSERSRNLVGHFVYAVHSAEQYSKLFMAKWKINNKLCS